MDQTKVIFKQIHNTQLTNEICTDDIDTCVMYVHIMDSELQNFISYI